MLGLLLFLRLQLQAELLQPAQRIKIFPVFNDFSIFNSHYINSTNFNLIPCR